MTSASATISGWGGYPRQVAQIITPLSFPNYKTHIQQQEVVLARGMGRSYGDCANAITVLQTTYCDNFLAFDTATGVLTVETGVKLRDVLKVTVKHGWFLPVTPGTSFVTVGGAIACDVHGKNHHIAGTFGQYVLSITMLLGTGEIVTASPEIRSDLFYATCGGMGLTGILLTATIKLIPIKSSFIDQKTIKANSLEETCEALEANNTASYSVAWIDCLITGRHFGRGVLRVGEHSDTGRLDLMIKEPIDVPAYIPAAFLNRMTMWAFNSAYWSRAEHNKTETVPLLTYFYPLDTIGRWNRLYGKAGFLQYHFALPRANSVRNMRRILTEINKSGEESFLAVLKSFGPANKNLLSFPIEGLTLAIDFKMSLSVVELIHRLDRIVIDAGGKIYLAKDSVMEEKSFKTAYPRWQEFELVRRKYGAIGKFASDQSKRLGLA